MRFRSIPFDYHLKSVAYISRMDGKKLSWRLKVIILSNLNTEYIVVLTIILYAGPIRYSTGDWLNCITTLPTSRILRRTKYNILFFTAFSAFLTWLYKYKFLFTLPATVHSIAGAALSLLLVFRTNAAYDRFWEGRKSWGSIIVACRDVAKHCNVHIGKEYHKKIALYLVLYGVMLKQHIQGDRIESEIAAFDPSNEEGILEHIQKKRNRPLQVLLRLEQEIHMALKAAYPNAIEAALHERGFQDSLHTLSVNLANW